MLDLDVSVKKSVYLPGVPVIHAIGASLVLFF